MGDILEVVRLTGCRGIMTKIIAEMTPEEYKVWQIDAKIEVGSENEKQPILILNSEINL